jgi:hypothetical protein
MKKLLLLFSVLGLLLTSSLSANASNDVIETKATHKAFKLPVEQRKELEEKLASKGIKKETINSLISKLERGEIWDSLNPDVVEKVDSKLINPSIDNPYVFYTFPDGSYIESSISKTNDSIGIMASTCGTGYCYYTKQKISRYTSLVDAFYYADFTINYGAADRISYLYPDYSIEVLGGTWTDDKLEYIRSTEDTYNNLNAKARLKFTYTINTPIPAKSKVASLYLIVGDDTWYSSADF